MFECSIAYFCPAVIGRRADLPYEERIASAATPLSVGSSQAAMMRAWMFPQKVYRAA